ncbi:CbiX/SirB N-terminal domain-containing protein [Sedimentitalea todarodis]|uniref:CbiX/SirB N-terminal domain-containing protein n=1 Tax=Sedimentitalea todarodis TaxID=1631240 RepID=A0ABU3VI19_9RHOB|nr:CbiX/SirB N-terminal domain-containing protein [Sedimentitalea todarodis]MDU9005795.1 CbiX/SirB N-terminal domain-containing protein [Sedimentitalea todarodis]
MTRVKTSEAVIGGNHASPGAIIVSHGQPSDPDPAETILAGLAARIAALMPGWTIASATLAKPGALETAAGQAGADALVYPLFMTDGWFTRTTLPKRLGRANAQILPPLGTDPALRDVAIRYLDAELAQQGWLAKDTSLIVASHGSGKSRNSARDTERFAQALAARMQFADIRAGYIEEPPFLKDAAQLGTSQAICLPFFAAEGGHVIEDIPEALDKAGFSGLRLPPIGTHSRIPAMIASALHNAARQLTGA